MLGKLSKHPLFASGCAALCKWKMHSLFATDFLARARLFSPSVFVPPKNYPIALILFSVSLSLLLVTRSISTSCLSSAKRGFKGQHLSVSSACQSNVNRAYTFYRRTQVGGDD